jgi:BarA-like signal transduction histidine kinase
MGANILHSERAVHMSVFVVRTFVRLRKQVAANQAVQKRLAESIARCLSMTRLCSTSTRSCSRSCNRLPTHQHDGSVFSRRGKHNMPQ